MKNLYTYVITIFFMLGLTCCDPQKKDVPTPETTFDKAGMLSNIGDHIIVPAYADFKITVDSFQLSCNRFISSPTLVNLTELQTKYTEAYKNYQRISAFEFGPAENELIRYNFNTFPCNTIEINNKIASGNMALSAASDLDAKGFPAIDFLLYGSDQNNTTVLARFTTDANASNAKNYLAALINELKYKTDIVNTSWNTYVSTFKNNTGSDVGGSIGMLVNQLNYDLEILKNAKVGIPLGKKTLGTPLPSKTEAVYSTQSLTLAKEHLMNIENIYLGRNAAETNGLGLDDYVEHVGAQHPLGPLNEVIKNKFISAKTKLAAIPETLSQSVLSNASTVNAAYIELQQLVVLLKVDMPSALGVMITYQDNDGD
ncbi:MAG: imelysin family protein [Bacteroidota bacterium]